jgi:SMODS and SLOG-associating 2TM effector domain 3/SMODS and SLOG-associating 2TM effector domain 1
MGDDQASELFAENFPNVFRRADASSLRAQNMFLAATGTTLALVAFAALMGAIDARWSGWIGAVAFLFAIVIGALAVTQNLERTWYDGRALAESAKSMTWLYVVRGGDFSDVAKSDEDFRTNLTHVRRELELIDYVVPTGGPLITERMRELRALGFEERRDLYVRERIKDQIGYYTRRGAEHARAASRLQAATMAAQLAGLGGAVLKATGTLRFDLLGVGAAAAASLTAWLQARDHVTLARAYQLTAEELDDVLERSAHVDESAWADFARWAESAISREHVMWLARRGRRPHG